MPLTQEFRSKLIGFLNKRMPKKRFASLEDKTYIILNKLIIKREEDKLKLSLCYNDEEVSVQYVDHIPDFKNGEIMDIGNFIILQEYQFATDQLIPFE